MQLAVLIKYAVVAFLVYFVAFSMWRMFPLKYEHYPLSSMSDIAKRDLSLMGDYGDKLTYSLRVLYEHIFQKLYVHCGMSFQRVAQVLHEHEEEFSYDPELIVHNLIDKVCYDLEKRWESYAQLRDNGREPFNVQVENKELPKPSTVLRFNDYLDVERLHALYYEVLNKGAV